MKEYTKALLNRFEEITGVIPISGRLGTGSMKEYIRIKVLKTEEVAEFIKWENYYRDKKKDFKGVHITYIDEVGGRLSYVYFEVKRKLLEKNNG